MRRSPADRAADRSGFTLKLGTAKSRFTALPKQHEGGHHCHFTVMAEAVARLNPFLTTKPTGEGTGLSLSLTRDIIVKQHGGRIDVETERGAFTEIIVTLPRGDVTVIGEKSE
jgi:hypothetical protein